jgi:hypothetical protein
MTSAPPTSGIAQLKKLLGFHIAEIAIGVWGIVKIRSGLENVYGEAKKEIFWGVEGWRWFCCNLHRRWSNHCRDGSGLGEEKHE